MDGVIEARLYQSPELRIEFTYQKRVAGIEVELSCRHVDVVYLQIVFAIIYPLQVAQGIFSPDVVFYLAAGDVAKCEVWVDGLYDAAASVAVHVAQVCSEPALRIVVLIAIDGVRGREELYGAQLQRLLEAHDADLVLCQCLLSIDHSGLGVILLYVYHHLCAACLHLCLGLMPVHEVYLVGHMHTVEYLPHELYLEAVRLSVVIDEGIWAERPVAHDDERVLLGVAYSERWSRLSRVFHLVVIGIGEGIEEAATEYTREEAVAGGAAAAPMRSCKDRHRTTQYEE